MLKFILSSIILLNLYTIFVTFKVDKSQHIININSTSTSTSTFTPNTNCHSFLTKGHWNRQKFSLSEKNTILNLPKKKYGTWVSPSPCSIHNYKISEIRRLLKNLLIIGDSRARQNFRVLSGIFGDDRSIFNNENNEKFEVLDVIVHDTGRMKIFNKFLEKLFVYFF